MYYSAQAKRRGLLVYTKATFREIVMSIAHCYFSEEMQLLVRW